MTIENISSSTPVVNDKTDIYPADTSKEHLISNQKSSIMYICIFSLWIFWMLLFDPRLFRLFLQTEGFIPAVTILLFSFCLNIFWLFGSYYLMLAIFTLFSIISPKTNLPPLKEFPPVAILYVTMHDFQEEAALSCVKQDYPASQVFILDDSLDEKFKIRVDNFAKLYPRKVTVIRRSNRKGFKAMKRFETI